MEGTFYCGADLLYFMGFIRSFQPLKGLSCYANTCERRNGCTSLCVWAEDYVSQDEVGLQEEPRGLFWKQATVIEYVSNSI